MTSSDVAFQKYQVIVIVGAYFTVFAPTDEAFQKIPQVQLKNKTWLENIVKFHIVQVNCPVISLNKNRLRKDVFRLLQDSNLQFRDHITFLKLPIFIKSHFAGMEEKNGLLDYQMFLYTQQKV